jgi:hypothetical protein
VDDASYRRSHIRSIVMSETSTLPWELVEANENHGAYIVDAWGADICDCYAMSNPLAASIRNGGTSFPVPFNNMSANAALIVQSVNDRPALIAERDALRAALAEAHKGIKLLEDLTACGSDDDYVLALKKIVEDALGSTTEAGQ